MEIAIVRGMWMPGVHLVKPSTKYRGLKEWIERGSYSVNSNASGDLEFFVSDKSLLVESITADCARFECAAVESLFGLSCERDMPKGTAWAAVRMYYASFFAAHSMLRVFGRACTNIESELASKISQIASVYLGSAYRFSSGFYLLRFDSANALLSISRMADTHKDTWSSFRALIADLNKYVCEGNPPFPARDRLEASNYFRQLISLLDCGGRFSGSWLSHFRNELNYRQSFDAWYPYSKESALLADVVRYRDSLAAGGPDLSVVSGNKNEVAKFFGTTAAIVGLSYSLARDLDSVAGHRSIHSRGAFSFMKMAGAA